MSMFLDLMKRTIDWCHGLGSIRKRRDRSIIVSGHPLLFRLRPNANLFNLAVQARFKAYVWTKYEQYKIFTYNDNILNF